MWNKKEKKDGPQWLRGGVERVTQIQWRVPYFGGNVLRTRQKSQGGAQVDAIRVWLRYQVAMTMDVLNCNNATSRWRRNVQYDVFIIVGRVLSNGTVSEDKGEKN